MASSDVVVRLHPDTADTEAALQRCIELAERFNELWGDSPRPNGIERLEIHPGDTLVLRYDDPLDDGEIQEIRRQVRDTVAADAVILTGGLTLESVIRAEQHRTT